MKNVTVSLDDAVYRQARIRAAEAGKSLSAMVREYLQGLGSGESEFDRLVEEERELRKRIGIDGASNRLSRDAIHER